MEYQFTCGCGEEVSDFTRGGDVEMSATARCAECGSSFAVTITTLENKYE